MSSKAEASEKKKACDEIRRNYDACFKEWYTDKFLRGSRTPACLEEWEDYKECMIQSLKEKKLSHLLTPNSTTSTDPAAHVSPKTT